MSLIDPDTRDEGAHLQPDDARNYLRLADLLVAHLVLRPYLDAQSVVAEQLQELGGLDNCNEPRFLAQCLPPGRQWAMQQQIADGESVSVEMFQNALRLGATGGSSSRPAPT